MDVDPEVGVWHCFLSGSHRAVARALSTEPTEATPREYHPGSFGQTSTRQRAARRIAPETRQEWSNGREIKFGTAPSPGTGEVCGPMATAGSEVPRWARLDSPLLREMQSAIIVTDLAGTIQSCNTYAEVFFGRPASEQSVPLW